MDLSIKGLRVDAASGPGSRGGHVIGKTSTGKPIYANFNHPSHAGFTPREHYEAGNAHEQLVQKHNEAAKRVNSVEAHKTEQSSKATFNAIHHHRRQMDVHNAEGHQHFRAWVQGGAPDENGKPVR